MNPARQLPSALVRRVLFAAFTISGFAGLIYESIWSHYLKLLLGHAAYAQTIVLVLFMGGMAIGSWLCGRVSARIPRPLEAYAVVELLLGIYGWAFDPIFRTVSDFIIHTAAPAIAAPLPIELLKWSAAALVLLPACVLLGATFPLISAGVVRLSADKSGSTLGWLYFTNSIGAVAGVLTSGFVLIAWIGLPGTLLTAGLCNFALALIVYVLARRSAVPLRPVDLAPADSSIGAESSSVRLLLTAAFLTGAASFLYEIGWIRMLSLVLGSATHSFELMLGAFILGLALGAYWIRGRIDHLRDPMRLLAWVQVLMGTAALGTLVVYGWSFDWMGAIVRTLAKTDTGYVWFNVLSQGICVVLMMPVTFFAGMTLPLITALVLRGPAGESAIGRVYAANTWGAIVGVIVAIHFVMPMLGLRNVVVVGAAVDIGLGLWLLRKGTGSMTWPGRVALASLVVLSVAIGVLVKLDVSRLSSGVYRHGYAVRAGDVIFHKDGRTASIDVTTSSKGYITISTNGKPDAALHPGQVSEDDYTMILTGLLPLALKPDAEEVAVVGIGSGRSTHVFLGAPKVRTVDTIEIEPAMVEGARLFGPLVERAFKDPRSHIYIEDAKTFFARHQKKYDIIMSEPSNPWVSGVASLFSQEFYRQVKGYLKPGGVFVQWLQLYEFDDSLVASVAAALDSEFEDFVIYAADSTDILIAAVPQGKVPAPSGEVLQWEGLSALGASIGVRKTADFQIRWLGNRATTAGYVAATGSPPNSDYFPYLDQSAARYRYLQSIASTLVAAHPVTFRLTDEVIPFGDVSPARLVPASTAVAGAANFAIYFDLKYGSGGAIPDTATAQLMEKTALVGGIRDRCVPAEIDKVWKPAIEEIGLSYWPYLEPARASGITALLRQNTCKDYAKVVVDRWLDFLDAVTARDWKAISERGALLVSIDKSLHRTPSTFLVRELLLADYRRLGAYGIVMRQTVLGDTMPDNAAIRYLLSLGAS